MADPTTQDPAMDRKYDDVRESEIDKHAASFFPVAAGVLGVGAALLLFTWFVIKPRLGQINPAIGELAGWIVSGFVACMVFAIVFDGLLLVKQGSLLSPAVWSGPKRRSSRRLRRTNSKNIFVSQRRRDRRAAEKIHKNGSRRV